jgi:aminopeptidase 2
MGAQNFFSKMCSGHPSSSGNEREILPANVKPINYNITIVPALDTFKYSGQASVSLSVLEPTNTISANVKEVTVSNVCVTVLQFKGHDLSQWPKDTKTGRPSIQANNITYDKEFQTVTFKFDHEIPAGTNIMLHMDFEGIHNDQMAGFYRSGYTDSNTEKKYLAITQFESTDARRCFPCWDEPNLKATFDVTLVVPKYTTALSNMNVIEESDIVVGDKTLNCVKFATTPIMSTYLLAFCVGEFEYSEAVATPTKPVGAKPIVCRTYTLKGQKEQGKFALGVCTKTLEFFTEYFDVAYPLPKMDMIAIPDFGAGAMENWGLVTYRENAMLFDPAKSSVEGKQRVAYVVGHELAHQWFGNLVTMDWWNELWLNEGFATFVGWLAVDHIFPEWDIFVAFLLDDYEKGIELDCLRSSHPIEVDVKSPSEVEQIFDAVFFN